VSNVLPMGVPSNFAVDERDDQGGNSDAGIALALHTVIKQIQIPHN
jgi:hypothetical protein